MFAYILAALIMVFSAALLAYFCARTWLLLRATEARITATLDRDLKNGWRIWIVIRSLMPPMCMAV